LRYLEKTNNQRFTLF